MPVVQLVLLRVLRLRLAEEQLVLLRILRYSQKKRKKQPQWERQLCYRMVAQPDHRAPYSCHHFHILHEM